MTDVDALLVKREPKRNRYGQYLIPDRTTGEETAYQRATTLARVLADTYNLDLWQKRMTAKGLALRPDLFAQVAAASLDEKTLLDSICEHAAEAAGATEGRNVGSALHRFVQRIDDGEDITVPPPWDRDVAAYVQAFADADIAPVANMAERIVVVPSIGVAGTFDRELKSPHWTKTRIGDLKSAQKIWGWLEIAVQLAVYAHGDSIWDLDLEAHLPMPDVDQDVAVVMHVAAGTGVCTLYEVDIAAGWELAQLAVEVRESRKRKDLASVLGTVAQPAPPGNAIPATNGDGGLRAEHARQRVAKLVELGDVPIAWPIGVPTFRQARESGHTYTVAELEQVEAAISQAEKATDAPFGDGMPKAPPERIEAMIARLQALPADLLDQATVEAKGAGVPHLRTSIVNVKHLDDLDRIVAPLEVGASARAAASAGVLGDYVDDPEIAAAVLELVGCVDVAAATDAQVGHIAAVVAALDETVLAVAYADDGACSLAVTPKGELAVVAVGGGTRASAVVHAKTVADLHGRPRPRSVGAAVADPLLVALIVATSSSPPTNQPTMNRRNP